jgi:hypothetical protein
VNGDKGAKHYAKTVHKPDARPKSMQKDKLKKPE